MQIQIRQAELEQINVELSIGITERQREISRLKLQQEQVTCSTLLYSTLLHYNTLHYTALHYTAFNLLSQVILACAVIDGIETS